VEWWQAANLVKATLPPFGHLPARDGSYMRRRQHIGDGRTVFAFYIPPSNNYYKLYEQFVKTAKVR
jgi:hypothetical protein